MADLLTRFWSKVDKSGDCWVWTGARSSNGYGHLWVGPTSQGAHRLSYELAHGPIPGRLLVCHKCDNRPCVNPDHLFLGTWKDNETDCENKGRTRKVGPKGIRSRHAKLTDAIVLEIRNRYAQGGISYEAIGRSYGVTQSCIHGAISGRTWKHVGESLP